jgi:hypothetical protein
MAAGAKGGRKMKTFDEAIKVVFIQHKEGGPDEREISNMRDIMGSIMGCERAAVYLAMLTRGICEGAPKRIGKKYLIASTALTAFAAGIRVGQEMEKRELKG